MSDNPLAKYLPNKSDDVNTSLDLIDRANLQFSLIDILNKEFGYDIPYGGAGSTKLHCVWGGEHKDGGIEKCMRYYWDSDTAFCFRDHGVIDVVTIRAAQKGLSKVKTARSLLQEAGIFNNDPWNVRIEKIQEHLKENNSRKYVDLRLAEQVFNESLRSLDGYGRLQYKADIIQTKVGLIEELDPSWDLDQLMEWINKAKTIMRETVKNWQSET